ncbi:MAG: hypothetical protein RIB98_09355 [Acidimicrobiales bacterium]
MADPADSHAEELSFVLASLDDLEAERAAGDLDDHDYAALKSDYTTRAARLLRAAEDSRPSEPAAARSWRRVAMWTALVVIVAGLAGVLLADYTGSRGDGTVTGDIRETVRQRKFEAGQLLGTDPERALEIYDGVLEDAPSDAEALAYRGWLTRLGGDPEAAQPFVEDAILADPDYPDARVFGAAIALDLDDIEAAEAHIDALDEIDVPPFIDQLVRGQLLRARLVEVRLLTGEPDAFAASGLRVAEVARAADDLLDAGEVTRGLALHDVLINEARDDIDVLTEVGWFLARLALGGGDEVASSLDAADDLLTEALETDPAHPPALVYRAFVRFWLADDAGARADLAAFDAVDAGRDDLELLLTETGLRDELS